MLLMPQCNFSHFVLWQQEDRWCCEDWLLYRFNLLVRCPRRSTQHQFWDVAFVLAYNDNYLCPFDGYFTQILLEYSQTLCCVYKFAALTMTPIYNSRRSLRLHLLHRLAQDLWLNVNCLLMGTDILEPKICRLCLDQGSPVVLLESFRPADFSASPAPTHLPVI